MFIVMMPRASVQLNFNDYGPRRCHMYKIDTLVAGCSTCHKTHWRCLFL